MSEPILNHAWEDVADDVTGAIEKAVQPLLKKACDDIYGGLLETTQDYLRDNLAFNIASRISAAEREGAHARQEATDASRERDALRDQMAALKLHVTHLIYAIDRGYFSDSFLAESAFVESLRPYADPSFEPVVETTPTT